MSATEEVKKLVYLVLMIPVPFAVAVMIPRLVLRRFRRLEAEFQGPRALHRIRVAMFAWIVFSGVVLYFGIGFGMGISHGAWDYDGVGPSWLLLGELIGLVTLHSAVGLLWLYRVHAGSASHITRA